MMEESPDSATTHFGFRGVREDEKAGLVRGVFDRVADRYDLMNDLMSGGVHRIWKSVMLDRLYPAPGATLLDVAGGTGDIASSFVKRAAERPGADQKPAATAIICDINYEMMAAGRSRSASMGALAWVNGDAENLPLPDNSVDAYSIAFGIRNVTHITEALKEARRVLRPGGRFVCLEFSRPITGSFQKIYDAYSFNVIPWLGERVVGDRESYQYLVESIRRFPAQEKFAAMIADAGFSKVEFENLTGGVAALHMAWRL